MYLEEAKEPASRFRDIRRLLQLLQEGGKLRKSVTKGPTAVMMATLTGHVWGFDELFEVVLNPGEVNA